ncbi:exonuclease subunit SbcD [Paraburkholderia sp. DHOC27]|uniref:exonuclease subunit SbcD n=1 Tax=Paraburkholderia sp. DHOC27 TaxID=2303330 RepID=UPI000E3BB93A|nr:exonuclease subunit SbcD [Paraburkholderia sp. DHOC27]RFU48305.1 exonuclease subunit SbcD [Paraburkholderia sp. DHOC27]
MRILHTSDWHLGQHFMGKSRQPEHQALIDWMLVQVNERAVDAVVIAGDIFDTGSPPSYARELYSQLVVRLHAAGVALLLLGGNHDSVATLRESSALLACLSTTVVAAASDPEAQVQVLPLRSASGDMAKPGCIVCAVPFIRPRDVLQSSAGESADHKLQSLQAAIQAHYQTAYVAALARQAEIAADSGETVPIIATGHLTTLGAHITESVREIYVGSLETFPAAAFPPVAYVALGHIHRPQKVGGQEHIRYCGSPIALSFDEVRQQKEVLLVDLDASGLTAVTPLPVPRFQPLASLSGNLSELAAAIASAAANGSQAQPVWLEVTVSADDYLADLPARIQHMAEGLPVEILRIRRERGNQTAMLNARSDETLAELSEYDVFARRLEQEELAAELSAALSERYREVVSSLQEPQA